MIVDLFLFTIRHSNYGRKSKLRLTVLGDCAYNTIAFFIKICYNNIMKILFPSDTILVTQTFSIGQDWAVPIPAFFIVGSKDNTKKSIQDFSDEELSELILGMKKVRIAISKVLDIKNVYIFQNEDTEYGFHVWIFPRYEWMEKFGKGTDSFVPIMDYAVENMSTISNIKEVKNIAQKIKDYLSRS